MIEINCFPQIFNNLFNTIGLGSKENNRVANVYNTTNRAISRGNKNFAILSNMPLVSFLYFVIDSVNW